ncbi:cytochrome f [Halothece sp. PCC 7418]|uniref:cytochrome f n=1 Tax=Halothece sp. (strain PCC 7418) TaxID=65093 RepID=UPI0002A086E1|nr:cytochrome f [Halothece sp. PCC 7418]
MNNSFWQMLTQKLKGLLTSLLCVVFATLTVFFASDALFPQSAAAYPFWAQETAPETPRDATGRIVCANCHLAEKEAEVELPLSVAPDSVFEAVVHIPYDTDTQQVLGDGSQGDLNVGAVLMLPEGFKIAPPERMTEEMKEKVGDVFFQPYREGLENVVLVGPLPGDEHQEITFPVLSPDPNANSDVYFGKYPVYLGANRGRGQVYPAGNKSNNTVYNASQGGTITAIEDSGFGYNITLQVSEEESVMETIPPGPELIVAEGDEVKKGQALTNDPNVGGFGQEDSEIVLQSPARIKGLMAFVGAIMLAQVLLVLKKKQVERVQAVEMNF